MRSGTTTSTNLRSGSQRCAAWLTLPNGPGPHPIAVLAHGFGANHTMALNRYAQHFAKSGIGTLAFDYRHLGESEGRPPQPLSLPRHRQDIAAAAANTIGIALTSAKRAAHKIPAPLLVCVPRRETLPHGALCATSSAAFLRRHLGVDGA